MADVRVLDEGSISLLVPESEAAEAWFEEFIGQDNGFQPYWPKVVVEWRYVPDILNALFDEGFEIEGV